MPGLLYADDLFHVLDASGTDGAEQNRKVAIRRGVAGATRSLGNARNLQLECARFFHCLCLFLCMGVRQCY